MNDDSGDGAGHQLSGPAVQFGVPEAVDSEARLPDLAVRGSAQGVAVGRGGPAQ